MNLFWDMRNTDKTQRQQQRKDTGPCLLEGILEGNAPELALLLEAVRELLQMHHQHLGPQSNTQQAYRRLIERVRQLEQPRVPWIDSLWPGADDESGPSGRSEPSGLHDTPRVENPDGPALRAMILNVARTTLIHALVCCVAVQRRFVTGDIYGPGVRPEWRTKALTGARVRYAAYRSVPDTDVEALMVYIHDHEHILIAKTVETLSAARHWLTVVMPDIRAHYRGLQQQQKESGAPIESSGGGEEAHHSSAVGLPDGADDRVV